MHACMCFFAFKNALSVKTHWKCICWTCTVVENVFISYALFLRVQFLETSLSLKVHFFWKSHWMCTFLKCNVPGSALFFKIAMFWEVHPFWKCNILECALLKCYVLESAFFLKVQCSGKCIIFERALFAFVFSSSNPCVALLYMHMCALYLCLNHNDKCRHLATFLPSSAE